MSIRGSNLAATLRFMRQTILRLTVRMVCFPAFDLFSQINSISPFPREGVLKLCPETLSVFSCEKMISKNVLSIGGIIQLNVWKTRKLPSIPTARRGVSDSEFVIRKTFNQPSDMHSSLEIILVKCSIRRCCLYYQSDALQTRGLMIRLEK